MAAAKVDCSKSRNSFWLCGLFVIPREEDLCSNQSLKCYDCGSRKWLTMTNLGKSTIFVAGTVNKPTRSRQRQWVLILRLPALQQRLKEPSVCMDICENPKGVSCVGRQSWKHTQTHSHIQCTQTPTHTLTLSPVLCAPMQHQTPANDELAG